MALITEHLHYETVRTYTFPERVTHGSLYGLLEALERRPDIINVEITGNLADGYTVTLTAPITINATLSFTKGVES